MRFLITVLIFVLIVGIAAAIDAPQNNGIYFLVGIILVWMIARLFYGRAILVPLLIIPFCLFLIFLILLFITGPQTPLGFQWLSANMFFILLLILTIDLVKNIIKPLNWEDALLFLAIAACLLAYAEIFFWYRGWWEVAGNLSPPIGAPRPGSFVSHAVSLGGIINIVWPIAFFRAWVGSNTWKKLFYGIVIVLSFGALYFTASRTAWGIAFIQVIIIASGVSLLQIKSAPNTAFRINLRKIPWRRLLVLGAIILVILIVSYTGLVNRISETGRSLTTLTGRAEIWNITWILIKTSPIIGHGIGTFPMMYASMMPNWPDAIPSQPQAVNMFFHNGAETGIVGVVLILMILGITVRTFVRTWKVHRDKEIVSRKILIYFTIGISILLHNQFEFLFSYGHNSIYAVVVVIFLALVLFYAPDSEFKKASPKLLYPLIIVVLIPMVYGVNQIWAGYDLYSNGQKAASEGSLELARDQICIAVEENPNNAFFYFHCSLAYTQLAYEDKSPSHLDKAIEYQKMGLALDPVMAINWLNLGILQWETGQHNEALKNMRHATDIDAQSIKYRDPMIDINLARIAADLGNEEEALEAYKRALESNPLIEISLATTVDQIHVDASTYFIDKWGADLWEGWRAYLGGEHNEALGHINLVLAENPKSAFGYALLAAVENELGNQAEAEINIRKALFIGSGFRTLAMAGHIYRLNGRYPEASKFLLEIIEKSQTNSFVWKYYYFQYQETNSSAYSPFLISVSFREAMIDDLIWLANYQEQLGNFDNAQKVRNWILQNTPDQISFGN